MSIGGNSCQPLNGNLLGRPCGGGGHVFRIEISDPVAPHSDECPRCQLIDRFPRVFDGRKRIPPDRAFAPFFAFLPAFASSSCCQRENSRRASNPPPSRLASVSVPRSALASCWAMARPSPVPPVSRLREASIR